MSLLALLNESSPWVVAVGLIAVAEVYSIGLMLIFRTSMGPDRLSLNNEVAGFKFAVVGVFYAVLLAFVVVAVWEDYRDTETAVRNEAKALVDLHQASSALSDTAGERIRQNLISYAEQVRDLEWSTMAKGLPSDSAAKELHRLNEAVLTAKSDSQALHHHAIDLLTAINDNRNERLDSSDGSVPTVLWVVLLAGAVITLGYPSFFGSSNITAQVLMTAALAALVALTGFVAVVLDYPFTGNVQISRAPLEQSLKQMPAPLPSP
jgi:hypothetical protein